jgi:hypothetical protein
MAFWSSWKRGNKPRKQYYGGSEEAYKEAQQRTQAGIDAGAGMADQGVEQGYAAADAASEQYGQLTSAQENFRHEQDRLGQRSERGFDKNMQNYGAGRGAILDNASALEADAANMAQSYQQTADSAFRANQSKSTRQAAALASRGGAAGLRAALAGQQQANADAQAQAEITRANEFNQIAGMRQNALQSAAGIRSGVGAQDQSAAGVYSNRQQGADANTISANAGIANNIAGAAGTQQNAAALGASTGASREQAYMDAQQNMENAQLNTARENEQQRLAQRSQRFNRLRDPFGIHGGT